MFRHVIYVLIFMFIFCSVVNTQAEQTTWNQDMFNDLVTYLYTDGELIVSALGIKIYNITLPTEENPTLVTHLGFVPEEDFVILTVEKFTYEKDKKIIDHVFYTSYYNDEIGCYNYLPNKIDGNHILLGYDNLLIDMTSKIYKEYDKEGYNSPIWVFWMDVYYKYIQEKKAEGRST